jgi:hypothetical protein
MSAATSTLQCAKKANKAVNMLTALSIKTLQLQQIITRHLNLFSDPLEDGKDYRAKVLDVASCATQALITTEDAIKSTLQFAATLPIRYDAFDNVHKRSLCDISDGSEGAYMVDVDDEFASSKEGRTPSRSLAKRAKTASVDRPSKPNEDQEENNDEEEEEKAKSTYGTSGTCSNNSDEEDDDDEEEAILRITEDVDMESVPFVAKQPTVAAVAKKSSSSSKKTTSSADKSQQQRKANKRASAASDEEDEEEEEEEGDEEEGESIDNGEEGETKEGNGSSGVSKPSRYTDNVQLKPTEKDLCPENVRHFITDTITLEEYERMTKRDPRAAKPTTSKRCVTYDPAKPAYVHKGPYHYKNGDKADMFRVERNVTCGKLMRHLGVSTPPCSVVHVVGYAPFTVFARFDTLAPADAKMQYEPAAAKDKHTYVSPSSILIQRLSKLKTLDVRKLSAGQMVDILLAVVVRRIIDPPVSDNVLSNLLLTHDGSIVSVDHEGVNGRSKRSGNGLRKSALTAQDIHKEKIWTSLFTKVPKEFTDRMEQLLYEPTKNWAAVSAMFATLRNRVAILVEEKTNPLLTDLSMETLRAIEEAVEFNALAHNNANKKVDIGPAVALTTRSLFKKPMRDSPFSQPVVPARLPPQTASSFMTTVESGSEDTVSSSRGGLSAMDISLDSNVLSLSSSSSSSSSISGVSSKSKQKEGQHAAGSSGSSNNRSWGSMLAASIDEFGDDSGEVTTAVSSDESKQKKKKSKSKKGKTSTEPSSRMSEDDDGDDDIIRP